MEQMFEHKAEKKGKWIIYNDCEGKTRTCTCSICGYKTGPYTWENPNFCANCGADMRGIDMAKIGVGEVEAIPVEWIKDWADERCCGDLTIYGELFYDMIEDWEEEIEI